MRIYIDTCVYNRPFDDQSQPRVWLETQALMLILQTIRSGKLDLVASSVLSFESSQNPFPTRREWVEQCCGLATTYIEATDEVHCRARELQSAGIDAEDALHVACAEATDCELLVTCDDRLVARCPSTRVLVVGPLDAIVTIGDVEK